MRFLGRDQFHRHAEGARHADQSLDVFHAFGRGSQPQAADLAPGSVLSGLVFQPAIQVGAVVHHAGQVGVRAHLAHQPGRVPGGAAGQFVTFKHDDIFPTHEGEMVGDTAPTDATADDDNLSMRRKIRHFDCSPLVIMEPVRGP